LGVVEAEVGMVAESRGTATATIGGATIFCDPWTKGKAFNEGWSLLSASAPVPYEKVDYIWISYEHPDHFSFPTLKSIAEAERRRITVLYQRHSSVRIAKALRDLGFGKVQELPLYRWVSIGKDFRVLCGSVGSMDSFLAVRADGESVLNINDCFCTPAQIKYIQRQVGKLSLLFAQFSLAN
jgi:UDP-MurNAc hydroxylase